MPETPDVLERAKPFMQQCGPCDYGLPYPCACPEGDFRPVVADLVAEVERLRNKMASLTGEDAVEAAALAVRANSYTCGDVSDMSDRTLKPIIRIVLRAAVSKEN